MWAAIDTTIGFQPFDEFFVPDTTARHKVGTVLKAVDDYWGLGEFIYLKSNDTILNGSVVTWDETHVAVLCPNTAGQGFPVGCAMGPATAGKYFWAQIAGFAVYKTGSTVAADTAVGLTAAGVVGTLAAGKQILNCRNRKAATATTTWTAITYNGLSYVDIPTGYGGIFLGMALSGTGVPASTVVAALDPNGKRVYMGSAVGTVDKTATASGSITLTGTYTGYGAGVINRPFAQGQIL